MIDKTIFHKTIQNLQDCSIQDQDQDRFNWSQTSLVLRPTVSDHITVYSVAEKKTSQSDQYHKGSQSKGFYSKTRCPRINNSSLWIVCHIFLHASRHHERALENDNAD